MKLPDESIRIKNSIKILDLLIKQNMSRIDLSNETGLTKTTVGEIVRGFLNMGLIEEEKIIPRGVGRPSINLKIVNDFAYVIGIGIMRDGINGCIIDAQGEIIYKKDIFFTKNISYINTLYNFIDDLVKEAKMKNKKVKAISFGVPGPLDTTKGIIKQPPKLPEFVNYPLVDNITKKYKVSAYIENDADMGAIGERYYGSGDDLDSFIYILYDKGIGAGIMINDQLYHGINGYAGEIGHTLVFSKEKLKYFEDEYGLDRILERFSQELSYQIIDINEIRNFSKEKERLIYNIQEELVINLSIIILNLIHYFGISNILIGGKAKFFGENLLLSLRKYVNKYLFHEHKVNIVFSDLDDYAISLGAAKYGLIKFLQEQIMKINSK